MTKGDSSDPGATSGSETLAARLRAVQTRIEAAAARCGRDPGGVSLVAVSKKHPAISVRQAYEAGQRVFGENYAQELAAKAGELLDLPDISWHMIGHLQSNKVRLIVPIAPMKMVESVDSAGLVRELGRRAAGAGRVVEVLVEVNVAGEGSKTGCRPEELGGILDAIGAERALMARGLMTMPPYSEDPRAGRPWFAALRELRDRLGGERVLPELSMGMSHDFEEAIAEGATMVRVGTAIFGARS
jgi:pyridoxal phosphate enzyme (YggS family)